MARITKAAKADFLVAIAQGLTETDAAHAAGIVSKRQFARHRTPGENMYDRDFHQAYDEAREAGNDMIRAEIRRRALDGVDDVKVIGQGDMAERVEFKKYSDTLLLALANSHLPEYREVYQRGRGEQGPPTPEVTHGLDLSKLTDAELDTLRTLTAKARPPLSAVG